MTSVVTKQATSSLFL